MAIERKEVLNATNLLVTLFGTAITVILWLGNMTLSDIKQGQRDVVNIVSTHETRISHLETGQAEDHSRVVGLEDRERQQLQAIKPRRYVATNLPAPNQGPDLDTQ